MMLADDGLVTKRCASGSDEAWARFDDLVAGTGLLFGSPHRVLVANSAAEVVPVLMEAEQATRQGCWAFGYVGYEAAAGLDPCLAVCAASPNDPPLVWFGLCDEPTPVPPIAAPGGAGRAYTAAAWQPGWTRAKYRDDVARIRDNIAAGDTYQCNLTSRLHSTITGDAVGMYADLALNQRSRYAAYLDLGRYVIASASPELFFEWVGDRLLTRPMKGTAARGRTCAGDQQRRQELLGSTKERAENVIIVDLLRNDVGRIAAVGSVRVPALCVPERYETVWQLTSDVTGTLRAGVGLVDIFRALFPCGSVTGAPKPRTMQIIREVEDESRGVYCGAIGFLAPPGAPLRARFNVAIRTMVLDRANGHAVYGTGGGITWGSDPDAELAELHTKAQILHSPYQDFQLLETMAHVPGRGVRHLDRHLDRLAGSADYFSFPFDAQHARADLAEATRHAGPARVRLLLDRCGTLHAELAPMPSRPRRPVELVVDAEPVDSTQRWLYHKTTRRHTYTSRARRHPDADDVVLVNEHGQLTETTIANLAVRLDGTWWTPPVAAGCLPGIQRAALVELGQLRERALTPRDLYHADRIAVLNSLRGWRPAVLTTQPGHHSHTMDNNPRC